MVPLTPASVSVRPSVRARFRVPRHPAWECRQKLADGSFGSWERALWTRECSQKLPSHRNKTPQSMKSGFLACGHALGGGGATLVMTKVVEKIFFSDVSKTKSGLQIAIESGLGDFWAQKNISGDPKILGPKWSSKNSRKFLTSQPPKMVNPTT